jgi:hypothetical protein
LPIASDCQTSTSFSSAGNQPVVSPSTGATTRSAPSDIARLPEFCNRRSGTTLLHGLQAEAAAAGKPRLRSSRLHLPPSPGYGGQVAKATADTTAGRLLRIHVERFNPALRLDQRLGFRQIDDRG